MEPMDERAKAELYKINQEKFFISVIIIAVFLIIKINFKTNILGMLGEITAAAIIALYLVPYFILRYKYKTIDEMVKSKLCKLSTVFFSIEMLCMIPVFIIDIILILNRINEPMSLIGKPINIMDSSFPFVITLGIVTSFYGLIRMHNEKFLPRKSAEISLANYKRKLLIRAIIASAVMVALIVVFAVVNNYISKKTGYPESETLPILTVWFNSGMLFCVFGIPACWFLYYYYLTMRKKLEKKINEKIAEVERNLKASFKE